MLLNDIKCPNCQTYFDPTLNECPECHKSNELYERSHALKNVFFFPIVAQIGIFLAGFAYVGMLLCEIIISLFCVGLAEGPLRNIIVLTFTYLLMAGGMITIAMTTRRKEFLKRFTRPLDYGFGVLYAGAIILTSFLIGLLVSALYKGGDNSNQTTAIELVSNYPILAAIVLCLLGPVCEELAYRVGLYSFLRRINVFLAMGVTVVIFAFIHFDFTAKDMISELWALPSYIACGLILTLAYEHRGPACSILAHIAYNTLAFITIFTDK